MKYRVGKKQSRVILDENGNKVAECLKGNEDVAKQICDLLNEHGLVSELPKNFVSKKGDYVKYKGGSTSKLLIKGNKYRLTCSPFRDRIAIINEGGSRMNTLKKYFCC